MTTMRKRTDYIVVHVTATQAKQDIGIREVAQMHKQRGWSRPGYRYVIRRNAVVENDGDDGILSNHVSGFNSIALGISLVGGIAPNGKAENNLTDAQFVALEQLIRRLLKKYPNAKVCGHRDLSPDRDGDGVIEASEWLKECPCFDAIPWAKSKGLPAAPIRGQWDRLAPPPPRPDPDDARNTYLQRLLQRAGYAFGPCDGDVGPRTRAAIEKFQRAECIKVTREFDALTVKLLRDMIEGKA